MESLAARPVHRVLVQEVPDLPKEPVEMSERETDPEVLDRAVEEGRESVRTGMHVNTTQGYQEQEFRAIAAAAYRQGREDLEARIEAKAAEIDRAADKYQEDGLRFTESGDHAASMGAFNYETRSRDVAKLLRSLLTDKEEA